MRTILLIIATLASLTSLTALLEKTWFFPIAALTSTLVILIGAIARKLLRKGGINTFAQAGFIGIAALIAATQFVPEHADPTKPLTWPAGILYALSESGAHLATSWPPVTYTPSLALISLLAIALYTLLIDIVASDLRWRTASALIALALALAPTLHISTHPTFVTYAGPVCGALLLLAQPALEPAVRRIRTHDVHHAGSNVKRDGGAALSGHTPTHLRENGAHRRILATSATATIAALALTLTPLIAPALTFGIGPSFSITLEAIARGNIGTPITGLMVDNSVSVRRELNTRETVEILHYTTDAGRPLYLRTRVLTQFNGTTFTAPEGTTRDAAWNATPSSTDTLLDPGNQETEHVNITIQNLVTDRVPTPQGVRDLAGSTDFKADTAPPTFAEIEVNGGVKDLRDQNYLISAEANLPSAQQLASVTQDQLNASPSGLDIEAEAPARVKELAAAIVRESGASTPFEQAIAIQEHFRDYNYSLTTTTPVGQDPLESFLEDRTGYCEQFAATYALMMNSLGYPTRVVLGYTGGTSSNNGWTITNRNAHAWPEVWFGPDYGWVRFEPTPASGGAGISPPDGYSSNNEGSAEASAESSPQETVSSSETPTEAASEQPSGDNQTSANTHSQSEHTETSRTALARSAQGSSALRNFLAGCVLVAALMALGGAAVLASRLPLMAGQLDLMRKESRRKINWIKAHADAAEGKPEPLGELAYAHLAQLAAHSGQPLDLTRSPSTAVIEWASAGGYDLDPELPGRLTHALYGAPIEPGSWNYSIPSALNRLLHSVYKSSSEQ